MPTGIEMGKQFHVYRTEYNYGNNTEQNTFTTNDMDKIHKHNVERMEPCTNNK